MAELDGPVMFDKGRAAVIGYDVPLPNSHTGRRIVALDLGLGDEDWTRQARRAGTAVSKVSGVTGPQGMGSLDPQTLRQIFAKNLASMSAGVMPKGDTDKVDFPESVFVDAANRGHVVLPVRQWGGRTIPVQIDPNAPSSPRLMIVEVYGISSFLGRYGMGRTVNTFTLLPGEETKITLKTWRSMKTTRKEATSIIDSHEGSASTRFAEAIQQETSEKRTESTREAWQVEANVDASWGWGSASVSGGASGEYHTGRESFARAASETTKEHCAQASQKRELSVSASEESTVDAGDESFVQRTIRNINVRRTLNFVFRELNQEYITKLHLKDMRIAFTNGRRGSYREVPISGMRSLLSDVVAPAKVDWVARQILKAIAVVFDKDDKPVRVIEQIKISPDLQDWEIAEAKPVNGEYPAPTDLLAYRFKKGCLGQGEDVANPVDGVVLKEDVIVMRTDSVCVEALVGGADALDQYALQVQEAAAQSRRLANLREELAQETLRSISDAKERALAYARMFNGEPEDQEEPGGVPL